MWWWTASKDSRRRWTGNGHPSSRPSAVPEADSGPTWWSAAAVAALTGTSGRVVHGECGSGFLLEALAAAGTDAYGVDPNESAVESAVSGGLDVRAESVLDHLDVVADESLSGIVLSGSVQWLHPNERDRLTALVASRLDLGGVLVLHSMTPEAWTLGRSRLLSDLAPGRPLHAETWTHLLGQRGFGQIEVTFGSDERSPRPGAVDQPGRLGYQRGHRRGQHPAVGTRRLPVDRRSGAVTAVHQFVPALLPRDATGFHTLALRETFRAAGWDSDIYVEAAHDELKSEATYFERYPERAQPDDILLYQLSTASPVADFLLDRPEPLVLDYHNITPASFYDGWEDHTSEKVALARLQMAALAPRAVLGIADSSFNAEELRRFGCPATAVIPILIPGGRVPRPLAAQEDELRLGRHRATGRERYSCSWAHLAQQGPTPPGGDVVSLSAMVRPRGPTPPGGSGGDRVVRRVGVRPGG